MQDFMFAIGHIVEKTFDWFLKPFGWLPVTVFVITMALGSIYWLILQARYTRRAEERGEQI